MTEPTTDLPFKKAGVVIHGLLENGKHALIATYSEGRFGNDQKYYMLASGTIDGKDDKAETPLRAALRETEEETGVDMQRLLTPEGVARLERGETLENLPSGYPGVTIRKAEPYPVDHTYLTRTAIPRRTALFGIEVDGIVQLRGALKNQQNMNPGDRVSDTAIPIRDVVGNAPDRYPDFTDYITWLRDGQMPSRAWNASRSDLPAIPEMEPDWFRGLEKKYNRNQPIRTNGHPLADRAHWQKFCAVIPAAEFRKLTTYMGAMKQELRDMHILNGDNDYVKLDEKDCPLFYYQEGADIITAEQFIRHSLIRLDANHDFAKAHGGACNTSGHFSKKAQLLDSQIAGVTGFIAKKDIRKGVANFERGVSRAFLRWDPNASVRDYHPHAPLLATHERLTERLQRQRDAAGETAVLG